MHPRCHCSSANPQLRFRRLLYWTDWGQNPKIERSFLDGTARSAIVTTELGWPNGLAIDYDGHRLYWADAQLDRIETADLSGRFRVQLVQGATHPFGLTQLGGYLYWTDWRSKSIERVDKATGKQRSVLREGLEGLMEIRAVAKDKQTGRNPCSEANGGCSHLCLFRAVSYVCSCPDIPDNEPCTPSKRIHTIPEEFQRNCNGHDLFHRRSEHHPVGLHGTRSGCGYD